MNTNLSHAIGDYVPISGGTVTGDLTVNGTFTFAGAVAGGDQAFTNVGDMTFAAGSIIASGSTNGNTLLLRANDTTFITLTTGATDVCTLAGVTLSGTILASGTVVLPNFTFGAQTTLPAGGIILGTAGSAWYLIGGASTSNDSYIKLNSLGSASGAIGIATYNGTTSAIRCTIAGGTPTVVVTWALATHAGMVLSDALTFTGTNYSVLRDDHDKYLILSGGTSDLLSAYWTVYGKNHATLSGYAELRVPDAAKTGRLVVFQVTGATDTPAITWLAAATHSSLNLASGEVLKVAGTQVVGARVVDARADDVVDTTYGAEEAGVIDALRDAMIAHGLIAAA